MATNDNTQQGTPLSSTALAILSFITGAMMVAAINIIWGAI